jgi:hypothetical protein
MLSIKLVELNKRSVVDQSLCAPYDKLLFTFVAVACLKAPPRLVCTTSCYARASRVKLAAMLDIPGRKEIINHLVLFHKHEVLSTSPGQFT